MPGRRRPIRGIGVVHPNEKLPFPESNLPRYRPVHLAHHMTSRTNRSAFRTCWLLLAFAGGWCRSADLPNADAIQFFENRIRPVLVEHCYECHSAESKKLKGGLYLDTRAGWVRGGDTRPAIEPGNPDHSLLIEAVRYANPDLQMPPKGRLPDGIVADLVTWVRKGAADPREAGTLAAAPPHAASASSTRHWAFEPLREAPAPPIAANPDGSPSPRTPVDAFIMAALRRQGLALSPMAGRRTLFRRASLLLTGLPPQPEELAAFERDPTPDAFGRAVDRLLASPRYGERWGRAWLDVARFAESSGFEHDYDRPNAWPYRDYVVHAFNADQPYDQFVRWQLAGDEFAPADPWALMATGFLGAGVFPTQITANEVERARYDALDDMSSTTGAAFLGLSVGCARCHDHKFDPIATRDYYRLLSTFTTTVRSHVDLDLIPEENLARLRSWEQQHALRVAARERLEQGELETRFRAWSSAQATSLVPFPVPPWLVLHFEQAASSGGATLTELPDGSYRASGKNPDFDRYTFVARTTLGRLTGLRVEALADNGLVKNGPGRADNGNFALGELSVAFRPLGATNDPVPVPLRNPRATFEQKGLPVAAALDGNPKSGWAVDPEFGKDHAAAFELQEPLDATSGVELHITLSFDINNRHSIARPRISVTTDRTPPGLKAESAPEPMLATVLSATRFPESEWNDSQRTALRTWHRLQDPEWRELNARVETSLAERPKQKLTTVMVATEGLEPIRMHTQGADFFEQTFFLKRGDLNLKGDPASQGFLPVLMRQPESRWQETKPGGSRTSYRRRALANWITDPRDGAGELLARVMVNRVWALHFGRGLVATPNDFGRQGEPPTHPELLDWLAREFIRSGWSVKALQRLILDSAVWQQAGTPAAGSQHAGPNPGPSIDPDDRWLWRFPRHRLEAEAIRDSLLSVSGNLDLSMGGPGTLDPRQSRRSVYFMIKRSQLSPALQLFDAPDAVLSAGNRPVTITAPQALLFLNSTLVRDQAHAFARRLLPGAERSLEGAVRRGYELAVGRIPTAEETADSVAFLRQRSAGDVSALEPALGDFCQVLLGLNEFIYVE